MRKLKRSFSKPRWRRQRERYRTKGLVAAQWLCMYVLSDSLHGLLAVFLDRTAWNEQALCVLSRK